MRNSPTTWILKDVFILDTVSYRNMFSHDQHHVVSPPKICPQWRTDLAAKNIIHGLQTPAFPENVFKSETSPDIVFTHLLH